MKKNDWASRFGERRRRADHALLRALELQIASEEKAAAQAAREASDAESRAAIARAFGRPQT